MKYTSKKVDIQRADHTIYGALSSFSNFTPILGQRVEGWEATEEHCSFKAQGIQIGLKMADRLPSHTIRVVGDECGLPFPFAFALQLEAQAPQETRLHIVLDVELNMMMKMMLGGKLQHAVDTLAEQIAHAFNNAHI